MVLTEYWSIMQIKRAVIRASVAAAMLLSCAAWSPAWSQLGSSVNTYSPYSLYGIGELSTLGTANIRSMGGAGIAFRDTKLTSYNVTLNYLNPASYSSIPQTSFLFHIGLEGANYYLKDGSTSGKSSFNSFNIRDIGLLLPLTKKLGFSFSLTPYSNVGYNIVNEIEDPDMATQIGSASIKHTGEGDISQAKAGIGMEIFSGFSLGLEAIYYFGYIDREMSLGFRGDFGDPNLSGTMGYFTEEISRMSLNAGFQYNIISQPKRMLTLGGAYRMGTRLKSKVKAYVPATGLLTILDELGQPYNYDIVNHNGTGNFELADVFSLGMYYYTGHVAVGADWSFANWGARNGGVKSIGSGGAMTYRNANSFKAGVQYTPNRFDARRLLSRITYRLGVRYEQGYMRFAGKNIDDKAVSLGFGIPFKMGSPSNVDIGLEYGMAAKEAIRPGW